MFWRFLGWNNVIGTGSVWIGAPLVGSIFEHVPNVWGCLDIWKLSYLPRKRGCERNKGLENYRKNTQIPFYFQQSSPGKLRKPGGTKVTHSEGTPPPPPAGRGGSALQINICLSALLSATALPRWRAPPCFASLWAQPYLDVVRTKN